MWLKTVVCLIYVVTFVLSEEILENNEIDSEDFLMQDLLQGSKTSADDFSAVNKHIAERASESESDLKYILAKDIQQRIEALENLNNGLEAVKSIIDNDKREVKDLEKDKLDLSESEKTSPKTEIFPSNQSEAEELSRTTRQYYPINLKGFNQGRQFVSFDQFNKENQFLDLNTFERNDYERRRLQGISPSSSSITYDKDPYIARYNPSARTIGVAGLQGGFQANIKAGPTEANKEGNVESIGEKTGTLEGTIIKQGGIQGGYVHPWKGAGGGLGGLGGGAGGGGLGGGGIGAVVHPIKQIKYLLPNFLSALTTAIGGTPGGVGGGFGGGGGGLGGIGGGLGGGKHKIKVTPSVTVHKVTPQPIKVKPVAHAPVSHAPVTHVVPAKTEGKKGKGGFFYSKNIFFGKIGAEPLHKPYVPEGHYYNYPSYSSYPHGGHSSYSGYSYLSPFNFQYAERSPYYISYLPDAQTNYGAGVSPYPQGNSYLDQSYSPYPQGQYYYPIDVKNLNDGNSAQFQLYQDSTAPTNPSYGSVNTNLNPENYVRRNHNAQQNSSSEVSLEKLKADIEKEQRKIQLLQEDLKSTAEILNINQDKGKINLESEVDNLKSEWTDLNEEMKTLNEYPVGNSKDL